MPAVSVWILVAGFLFTLMSLSAKICSAYFSPFEIIFYRALFGTVCLGLMMLLQGIPPVTQHPWAHVKRCTAGISCFFLEILALQHLPLSVAQSIDYTSPLIFCTFFILMSLRGGQKVQWPIVSAVIVGFLGVLFIAKPSTEGISVIGVAYAAAAAFAGACTSWCLRDLGRYGEPNTRTVFYFMLAGTLVGGVAMMVSPEPVHAPTVEWFWPLAGLMTTGFAAQVLSTYAWAKGHSLLNAVFQFAGIFFGVFLGMFAFGETLDWLSLIGVGVIFSAGLFSSIYLKKH